MRITGLKAHRAQCPSHMKAAPSLDPLKPNQTVDGFLSARIVLLKGWGALGYEGLLPGYREPSLLQGFWPWFLGCCKFLIPSAKMIWCL